MPDDQRGRDATTTRFNGRIEANSHTREDTYENVIVSMYGIRSVEDPGYKVIIIEWPKRPCVERPNSRASVIAEDTLPYFLRDTLAPESCSLPFH